MPGLAYVPAYVLVAAASLQLDSTPPGPGLDPLGLWLRHCECAEQGLKYWACGAGPSLDHFSPWSVGSSHSRVLWLTDPLLVSRAPEGSTPAAQRAHVTKSAMLVCKFIAHRIGAVRILQRAHDPARHRLGPSTLSSTLVFGSCGPGGLRSSPCCGHSKSYDGDNADLDRCRDSIMIATQVDDFLNVFQNLIPRRSQPT